MFRSSIGLGKDCGRWGAPRSPLSWKELLPVLHKTNGCRSSGARRRALAKGPEKQFEKSEQRRSGSVERNDCKGQEEGFLAEAEAEADFATRQVVNWTMSPLLSLSLSHSFTHTHPSQPAVASPVP